MHELLLRYDDDVHNRLHQLKQMTECGQESEVIRKALSYYHYLLTEVMNGGTVILQKADGTEEEIDVK